jgi:hypothetical protein
MIKIFLKSCLEVKKEYLNVYLEVIKGKGRGLRPHNSKVPSFEKSGNAKFLPYRKKGGSGAPPPQFKSAFVREKWKCKIFTI